MSLMLTDPPLGVKGWQRALGRVCLGPSSLSVPGDQGLALSVSHRLSPSSWLWGTPMPHLWKIMSPLLTHVTVEESLPWALRPGYLLLPGSPEAANQL